MAAHESLRLALGLCSRGMWSPAPIWMIIGRPLACMAAGGRVIKCPPWRVLKDAYGNSCD